CCSTPTGFVPPADGRMRFWRNTDVATLAASNATAQLPAGVIGYEWDEDLDNGSRPAGIIRMSTTTVNPVDEHLFDYGNTFAPDVATHHLTLYKHASGALVFGAGSIQWSSGLDRYGRADIGDRRVSSRHHNSTQHPGQHHRHGLGHRRRGGRRRRVGGRRCHVASSGRP